MKLKPRFTILFKLYLILGSVIFVSLFYVFDYAMGKNTEKNYIKIFEDTIQDTIKSLGELPGSDYAYTHKGTIKTIELKNRMDFKFALYLESYENLDNIMTGDYISKDQNTGLISIKSQDKSFNIKLKDITKVRINARKKDAIIWISLYLIIGLIFLFVPVNIK